MRGGPNQWESPVTGSGKKMTAASPEINEVLWIGGFFVAVSSAECRQELPTINAVSPASSFKRLEEARQVTADTSVLGAEI